MAVRPWPELAERHRWVVELMEECLERTTQGPGELSKRAAELRFEAGRTDIDGYRDAHLALADRYEQAATRRRKSS